MTTTEQTERLRQFFGAYFHQDWDADSGTPDLAISAAIRQHERPSEREELSRSIIAFAQEHPDDRDLDAALFKELGCEYFPPGNGISTRSWLLDVAAKLVPPNDS
jgi:hypothetical protein